VECRIALPLHPTYDHVPSGCAGAPPKLRPCSVGLRWRSTQPTTTFCRVALALHPTYDHLLPLIMTVCRLGAATQERNPTSAGRPPRSSRRKIVIVLNEVKNQFLFKDRFFAGSQDDKPFKLGAEARGRNLTVAPQTRSPKLVGLRWRSTQTTTTFCRVALALHPTYDHVLSACAAAPPNLRPPSVGLRWRSTQTTTTFCRVALALHPTYDLPLHPTYD